MQVIITVHENRYHCILPDSVQRTHFSGDKDKKKEICIMNPKKAYNICEYIIVYTLRFRRICLLFGFCFFV